MFQIPSNFRPQRKRSIRRTRRISSNAARHQYGLFSLERLEARELLVGDICATITVPAEVPLLFHTSKQNRKAICHSLDSRLSTVSQR